MHCSALISEQLRRLSIRLALKKGLFVEYFTYHRIFFTNLAIGKEMIMNLRFLFEGYRNRFQRIATHVVFWVLYLSLYSMLISIPSELTFMELIRRSLYFVWVDIMATYVLIYLLLPKFLLRRKYIWFVISFIGLSFITMILNRLINFYFYIPTYLPEWVDKITFWRFDYFVSIISSLAVAIFVAAIKLLKIWIQERNQKSVLQLQNLQSEMALLKNQINPHFIFNTLNNIDTLIASNPAKASESILKLSEIMRYVLYEATADYVPLQKEINYLNNFIALHTLKFGNDFIQFKNDVQNTNEIVAPMLFIPLVENAIKHGDKRVPSPGITIHLFEMEDILCFVVKNHISKTDTNKDAAGGIGMANLKRRLELLYPQRHTFTTEVENGIFTAKICLL